MNGYDGLSSVAVTTNISGVINWSQIGYSSQPAYINNSIAYAKDIKDNWDATLNFRRFNGNLEMMLFPVVDVSNFTSAYMMFKNCYNLDYIPDLSFSDKVTSFNQFCQSCHGLVHVGNLGDTSGNLNMGSAFNECYSLVDLPVIDMTAVTTISDCFKTCSSLSNTSLENIVKSLKTMTAYSGTKTLKYIGLTSAQATTCTSFTDWATLSSNGWSTGY